MAERIKSKREFERKLDAFCEKVFAVIQESRSKMTPRQRKQADRAADKILANVGRKARKSRG